jgi:hypothetical protein
MKSTEEVWAERVTAWRASGLPATQFSVGKAFTASGLRYWASRLKQASGATTGVTLARIVRSATDVKGQVAVEVSSAGARVIVEPGFDAALLREVVAALGSEA